MSHPTKEQVRKLYEELLHGIDLTESLMERYREYELLGDVFPPIYPDGEVQPSRIGWSGEEI